MARKITWFVAVLCLFGSATAANAESISFEVESALEEDVSFSTGKAFETAYPDDRLTDWRRNTDAIAHLAPAMDVANAVDAAVTVSDAVLQGVEVSKKGQRLALSVSPALWKRFVGVTVKGGF